MNETPSARHKEFVGEPIVPAPSSFDTSSMAAGEPGLPARFTWRSTPCEVACVLEKWKTTGPCKHGSGEQYVRRHWFRIETTDGTQMELYFDRQPRSRHRLQRWWLATIVKREPRASTDRGGGKRLPDEDLNLG